MRVAEPLLPDIATQFNTTLVDAATLITTFVLAYGLFQLVHGPLGDRFGKLTVTCGALFLASLSSVACATAQSLETLALFRFLTGMTAGAVIPLSLAYVGDNVPFEKRQPVMGQFISGNLMGTALGPLVGGVSSQFFGWRVSFVITALGFLAIGLLLLPLARRETKPQQNPLGVLANLKSVVRLRGVHLICAIVAVEGCLFYGAYGYIGGYLRETFQLDYVVIGMVMAGFGCGGLLYSASVKILVRRLGVKRMVVLGGFSLLLGFISLALMSNWHAAVLLIFILGFGLYLIHNTLQTLASEMAPATRGSAIAVFAFSLFTGQAIGVTIDGLLVDNFGYQPMFIFTGIGLLLLAIFLARDISSRE